MRYLKVVGLIGLISTTAVAAPYSYECDLSARTDNKGGLLRCEIEGTRDLGNADPLNVECSDGYEFSDADTDGESINDTDDVGIWGLSEGERDIVALVIRDLNEGSPTTGEHSASALISSDRGDAVRVNGKCVIEQIPIE